MFVVLIEGYQQPDYWISSAECSSLDDARNTNAWDGSTASYPKARWAGRAIETKEGGMFNSTTHRRETPAAIYQLTLSPVA